MKSPGPTSITPSTIPGAQRREVLPLRVGEQLQATVLSSDAGKVLLAIGHRQLSAESSLPFRPGEVLTLQVRSLDQQPVLRIIAALSESATATAVRSLLPRYGASTPLLASLSQLLRTPAAALPPPVTEAARALLERLPGVATLSTPQGVKAAIRNSGIVLEHSLTLARQTPDAPVRIESDYKANLLRLLQVVRDWPGGGPTAPVPPGRAASTATATPPQPPATPQSGPGSTVHRPPAAAAPPASPEAPSPGVYGSGTKTEQAATTSPPQAAQRAIEAAGTPLPQRPATGASGSAVPPPATQAAAPGAPQTPGTGQPGPPLPFAGTAPIPQGPVQAGIDLLNRLGHLRPDLLQQTEAALARVHLNQLASLPREGEHRLVEWLFDIPVRRGDDVDFWSARLYRDSQDGSETSAGKTASWSVQLAFDLPGLGPMQAQVNLLGERVSTWFSAARPEILPLLRAHLHELRRSMLEAGLQVADIDCRQGMIAPTGKHSASPLIDEKA